MSMEPEPPPPRPRAGPSGPRADFVPRMVGLLIDSVIVGLVNRVGDALTSMTVGFVLAVFVQLAYAVYFISSSSGQTPGMRIMGIRAIDARTGGRVEPGQALARWLMSIVSSFALLVGYFWMLWDPERQTWHDKVARTYVVPTAYYPVERWPG
jgi:uncharacterized RDD family membrane protein YckC